MEACSENNARMVQLLLENGADINLTNDDGRTAAEIAVRAGKQDILSALRGKPAKEKDVTQSKRDVQMLVDVSVGGLIEELRPLLTKGVDVNDMDGSGNTALTAAAGAGHLDIINLLLEKGANIDKPNENGDTALRLASKAGHTNVAKVLLERGANVNAKTKQGWTPIKEA